MRRRHPDRREHGRPLRDRGALTGRARLASSRLIEHGMLAGQPLGPVELSRRLGVTSAAATHSAHRLQAACRVVRTAHPADRRRQVLQVSPSARRTCSPSWARCWP